MVEAAYQSKERFVRVHLVFDMNSDRVRKDCLKIGNELTHDKVIKLSKTEESASDEKKIKTLREMERSKDASNVKIFMGMINYQDRCGICTFPHLMHGIS